MRYSNALHKSAGQQPTPKSYKKCSESENNVVGHTTFLVCPTGWLGPY